MPKADECKYTKTHEWVYIEGETAVVGISEYAQKEIGDIVFIELPKVDGQVEKGKQCAVIESVKAASDFNAPVSGTVVEVNSKVSDEPSLVNQSPLEDGWFFKVKFSDIKELEEMMDYKKYAEFAESQK